VVKIIRGRNQIFYPYPQNTLKVLIPIVINGQSLIWRPPAISDMDRVRKFKLNTLRDIDNG